MSTKKDLRGSIKLLEERCGKPISAEEIDRLVAILDRDGIQVEDFYCKGVPRPDVISVHASVSAGAAGGLTTDLLRFRDLRARGIVYFPKGIPWPELLEAKFEFSH